MIEWKNRVKKFLRSPLGLLMVVPGIGAAIYGVVAGSWFVIPFYLGFVGFFVVISIITDPNHHMPRCVKCEQIVTPDDAYCPHCGTKRI